MIHLMLKSRYVFIYSIHPASEVQPYSTGLGQSPCILRLKKKSVEKNNSSLWALMTGCWPSSLMLWNKSGRATQQQSRTVTAQPPDKQRWEQRAKGTWERKGSVWSLTSEREGHHKPKRDAWSKHWQAHLVKCALYRELTSAKDRFWEGFLGIWSPAEIPATFSDICPSLWQMFCLAETFFLVPSNSDWH